MPKIKRRRLMKNSRNTNKSYSTTKMKEKMIMDKTLITRNLCPTICLSSETWAPMQLIKKEKTSLRMEMKRYDYYHLLYLHAFECD